MPKMMSDIFIVCHGYRYMSFHRKMYPCNKKQNPIYRFHIPLFIFTDRTIYVNDPLALMSK